MKPTVYHTGHQFIRELLRGILRDAVQAGIEAAGGLRTVECQAVATLYLLLMDHPIDPRGRCRSCRRPGAVFGPRWRRCRVHATANLWLHHSTEVLETLLLPLLAHELGLVAPAPVRDPDDTDVPPAIEPDLSGASQTPAIPPHPTTAAGWPDPPGDSLPGRSLLRSGGSA